jgi:phosphatidylserine decarboxylase
MHIRPEVIPFLLGAGIAGLAVFVTCRLRRVRMRRARLSGAAPALVLCAYFLWFFRDPDRTPPRDPAAILAAADGRIAAVKTLDEAAFRTIAVSSGLPEGRLRDFLKPDVLRISIFLSLFDVHVNRAPVSGEATFLGYFPGKRFFTFQEKSSELNQHNSILIRNPYTVCLLNQIVGPVCRRVVYWPDHVNPATLEKGQRIGMMKFGSRLDMYFPGGNVSPVVSVGDRVRAGLTEVARLSGEGGR